MDAIESYRRTLRETLERENYTELEIDAALDQFDRATSNLDNSVARGKILDRLNDLAESIYTEIDQRRQIRQQDQIYQRWVAK